MTDLCKYKDMFGKVGEGAHSLRIANIAVIDVLLTLIGAYIIQRFLLPTVSLIYVTLGLFLLGIIMHRLFCVRTTVDKLLFK